MKTTRTNVPWWLGTALVAALAAPVALAAPQQQGADRAQSAGMAEPEEEGDQSNQPINDTWITTKVKAELMAADDVDGTDIDVDTVNGTVTLSGSVKDKAEADRAKAIAKQVRGVKSVNSANLKVAKAGGG
ncbi:BON domain-containing protein [Vulcaniibacterium tengchongense]|uniref:Osmotically-inducible protein Y n=1 Tax=Vulcaniibacterium tengchongense TaxID=1273429 RepID=A0A3N4VVN4_9GAMM|nr:BON domain-containing protein [Vulcaniibacterium tengchongense]RPE77134.1 hyperosmotically inducible protein [Vulcaniibacterium tengchongense]